MYFNENYSVRDSRRLVLEPEVFGDDRGFFFESFNQERFEVAIKRQVTFVQNSHSRSVNNVLRGLHSQI